MSDLGSLLRDHYKEIAPPIDVERLADRLLAESQLRPAPTRSKGALIAMAAAVLVLLVLGGTTLLIQLTQSEVVYEPTPTTVVSPTTVPNEPVPDDSDPSVAGQVGLPFTILDHKGDVGAGVSAIVGSDGIPLLAYAYHPVEDSEPSEIRIATCADIACTEPGSIVTIAEMLTPSVPPEEVGPIGVEIRTLLPDDGLPIVIWSEWEDVEQGGESHLKAYKCNEPGCSDGTLSTIVDGLGHGLWVAAGSDNLPLIAQRQGDWEDVGLALTKCTDPACADEVKASVVDVPDVGWSLAATVDGANLPVIAASLATAEEGDPPTLGIVRCTDPACTEPSQIVDTGVLLRELIAVDVDSQDRPVILAVSPVEGIDSPDHIVLIACGDSSCSVIPTVTPMVVPSSAGGDAEPFGSLVLADDGAVAVGLTSGGAVHVVSCADPTCSGGITDVAVIPGVGAWRDIDLALTPQGDTVIAIHSNSDVGVFVCDDLTCASSQIPPLSDVPGSSWSATIAAEADVSFSGTNPAIEIGPDGNPLIAYLGLDADRGSEGEPVAVPKLLLCADLGCTSSTTRILDDGADWVSMTILPDGRPVVAYAAWTDDWESHQLRLTWCADSECSTWTTELLAETGWINTTLGLAARPDGSIVAAYQDTDDFYVYVLSCAEGTCGGIEPVKIDSLVDPNENESGMRWWMNSLDLALLPDGRPVIAAAQSNGEVRFVECADQSCSSSERITVDQTLGDVTTAIDVGSNGLPILAHYDDGEMTVTACQDTACDISTVTAVGEATAGFNGSVRPSIAFGPDGNPMISYWAPRALMVAACHDPACTSSTVDIFAAVRTYDLAIFPDGSPVLTYFVYSGQEPPPGEEQFGDLVDLRVAVCTSGTCVGD